MNDSRFRLVRYGGSAALLVALVVAVLVVLNLVVGSFDFRLDLTANKLFFAVNPVAAASETAGPGCHYICFVPHR